MLHQNKHSDQTEQVQTMKKNSFTGLSLTVMSAAVFFVLLVFSLSAANKQAKRLYSSIHKHTRFISAISSVTKSAPFSNTESGAFVNELAISVCTPVTPDTKATPPVKPASVDPEDSAAELSAEQQSGKAGSTSKCKDATAPAAPGSNSANNKNKATPFSNKSKMHGVQKHFGVGLRFTI
jgi:hypothetical protein